jgi:hypothetical protein
MLGAFGIAFLDEPLECCLQQWHLQSFNSNVVNAFACRSCDFKLPGSLPHVIALQTGHPVRMRVEQYWFQCQGGYGIVRAVISACLSDGYQLNQAQPACGRPIYKFANGAHLLCLDLLNHVRQMPVQEHQRDVLSDRGLWRGRVQFALDCGGRVVNPCSGKCQHRPVGCASAVARPGSLGHLEFVPVPYCAIRHSGSCDDVTGFFSCGLVHWSSL